MGCELSPIIAIFALNPQFEHVVCQTFPPPPPQPVSAVNPLTRGGFPDPYVVRTIGFPAAPDFQTFNPLVNTLPHWSLTVSPGFRLPQKLFTFPIDRQGVAGFVA